MFATEYTDKRADALNKISFPHLELPLNLNILWVSAAGKAYLNTNIRKHAHEHSFFELHFVLDGIIAYTCGTDVFTLNSGEALFIPPHTKHHYQPSSEALKITLAFSADDNALELLQLKNRAATRIDYSDKITQCLNFILRHSEISDLFTSQLIVGRALEIVYSFLYALNIKIPKNSNDSRDPRFFMAKAYIENNSDKLLTCNDVSKECCLSTKQLSRIFKTETGQTLTDYIVACKIKQIKRLLLDTQYSVKEIGFLLGFENESNFVSFFKRHCELPPGAFRAKMSEK